MIPDTALVRLSETDITSITISPVTSYNRDGTVEVGDKVQVYVCGRTRSNTSGVAAYAFGPDPATAFAKLLPELEAKQSGEWFTQKRSTASPQQNPLASLSNEDLLKELGI
jgi:hypothetical protein